MVKIHEVEQGTEEWQELRRGKYTGSNAHKLLKHGAIPYALTESSEFRGNFFTKRGHVLEDEAIELYEAIHERTVSRAGFITNSKFPDCGYSPDGLDGQVLLEVKCFEEAKHLSINPKEVPLEILAQVHFGLLITEFTEARILLYHPKLDPKMALKTIIIKPNPAIRANFRRILTSKETFNAR